MAKVFFMDTQLDIVNAVIIALPFSAVQARVCDGCGKEKPCEDLNLDPRELWLCNLCEVLYGDKGTKQ